MTYSSDLIQAQLSRSRAGSYGFNALPAIPGPRRRGLSLAISGALALSLQSVVPADALAQSFPPSIQLSSLDGSTGFKLDGEAEFDRSGRSVSAAGDVNGDGIDDVIIGAYEADPNGNLSGRTYVVFGTDGPRGDLTAGALALAALDGSNGFKLDGEATGDRSGGSVSTAGDINGDGIDDLIIGAYGADPNGFSSGRSYVVLGTDGPRGDLTAGVLTLAALDGSNGFKLDGEAADDFSGRSVSAAGDINGDGIDDLIVGAFRVDPNGSNSGRSYVVFGTDGPRGDLTSGALALAALDGSNGFKLDGEAADDFSGKSVSAAGDVNGDGIDDLIVGADSADSNGVNSGRSYVVFGTEGPRDDLMAGVLALAALDGSNGFKLDGEATFDRSGWSVSGAGDINGDGVDDLIIGAYGADPSGSRSGRSYVVFGTVGPRDDLTAGALALAMLDGTNGFKLDGEAADDYSGWSVSAAGDINGDGIDDLIVGAPAADSNANGSGRSYVVFGTNGPRSDLTSGVLALSTLDGSNGFVLDGEAAVDLSGASVSAAGDVNGDGVDDLIIGAYGADPIGFTSGRSYVVFGGAPWIELSAANLNFGDVTVGQPSAAQTVTLSNTGSADLDIGNLALSGSNFADFALDADNCSGQTLIPAAECTFDISLTPSTTGARSAQLDIPSNAASSPDALPLEGIGIQAQIELTPDPVQFNTVLVGSSSGIQSVTVSNPGSAPLNVSAIDAASTPFAAQGGTCGPLPISVPAAGSCTLDYAFNPETPGPFSQMITVASDAAPGSDNQFTLAGIGTQPSLDLAPASLSFGDVTVGEPSATETVTLSNTGSADLIVGSLALSGANPGDFGLTADNCSGQTLAPAEDCTFDITLTPSATGARSAQVDVPSNAAFSPDALPLAGTGLQSQVALDTSALDFGIVLSGDSASATVNVSNSGDADLLINAITDPGVPFAISGGSCTGVPVSVQPGASCDIVVTFLPTDPIDGVAGSFDIISNAPSSPDTINLVGRGVQLLPVPTLNSLGLGVLALLMGWLGWRRRENGIG